MKFISAPLLTNADDGMLRLSDESQDLLDMLETIDCVHVVVMLGGSTLGKSLITALMGQSYGVLGVFRLRVNPTNAAETQGIDAILMVKDDNSGVLLLDTAGSDLFVTPLQTHVISTLALSVATSVVFFVDGELQDNEINRLGASISMSDQVQGFLPPAGTAPKSRLTVAYSGVSSTRRFDARETAVQHTIVRLTPRAGALSSALSIISAHFPLPEVGALVVPVVEAALGGTASLSATEVLDRDGVRAALTPTAQALLDTTAQQKWVGRDLAKRLRDVMAVVATAPGSRIMAISTSSVDTFHTCVLSNVVTQQRGDETAFLTNWVNQQPGFGTVEEDNVLRATVANRLRAVDALVHGEAQRLGAADSVRAEVQVLLQALHVAVEKELNAVVQRRVTARVDADNAAIAARAKVAALQKNAALVGALEAERRHIHASSYTHGSHDGEHHPGSGNAFKRRPYKNVCRRCGAVAVECGLSGGCPNNGYYAQPSWEAWAAQAKADGTWQAMLTERGYDFKVTA